MEITYVSIDIGLPNKKLQFYVDNKEQLDRILEFSQQYNYSVEHFKLVKLFHDQVDKVIQQLIIDMIRSKEDISALNNQLLSEIKQYDKKKKELKFNAKNNTKKTKVKKKVESDSD
jgi:GR25 family glycosyltransferase involved in LPS biosynthesis